MDILISVHNIWLEKIFNGEKPFEFRSVLPKNLNAADKIYFYETGKFHGCKMVIGEATVKQILKLTNEEGKYPCFGAYSFIDYYFSTIVGNKEIGEQFRKVKKEFEGKFDNYKYGFIINYALSELELQNIRKEGRPIDTFKRYAFSNNPELKKILEDNEKTNKCIQECDEWLSKIGFYDDADESFWKYAIELSNIKKYSTPVLLSTFKNTKNQHIEKAPQSFCYVIT